MDVVLYLLLGFCLFGAYKNLVKRVSALEEKLSPTEEKEDGYLNQFPPIKDEISDWLPPVIEKQPIEEPPTEATENLYEPFWKTWKIPSWIKDNWLAAVGSTACVIGSVFFGITSDIFTHPEVRLLSILAFSAFLFFGSLRLNASWHLIKALLRSTAAALVLFTCIGAGSIDGLKCFDSEPICLSILLIGISVNLYLAFITRSQIIASSHVLLSLTAFCVAPQQLFFLPLGAFIALFGLLRAYRCNWDAHLLLIVFGFSIQHTLWNAHFASIPLTHYIAIPCLLIVGFMAAAMHYRQIYKLTKPNTLSIIAHLSNWALLAWNIHSHVLFPRFSGFILLAAAFCGFFLARQAKKKEILWLYYADTCSFQLLALAGIATLSSFSISYSGIIFLAFTEILIFNVLQALFKETLLLRYGYILQVICCLFLTFLLPDDFLTYPKSMSFFLEWGLIITMSFAFYIFGRKQKIPCDSFSFLVFGKENNKTSLTTIFATLFFLMLYLLESESLAMQAVSMTALLGLGLWRIKSPERTIKASFWLIFGFCHLVSFAFLILDNYALIPLRIDAWALIFINLMILYKYKSRIITYVLATQLGLIAYSYPKSIYLTALAFIFYSFIALEVYRRLLAKDKEDPISKSLLPISFGFTFCFFLSFLVIWLSPQNTPKDIFFRVFLEILGLATLAHRAIYLPHTTLKNISAVILNLFFCASLLLETPFSYSSLILATSGVSLLAGLKLYRLPILTYLYAWTYLIASCIFMVHAHLISALGTIFLQLTFVFLAHKQDFSVVENKESLLSFLHRKLALTTLIPVFLASAIFFFFNYEKALLTLFWVGLSFLYLTFSLLAKSKDGLKIAMAALLICSARLLFFDLRQTDMAIRALVFLSVGILMLLMSMVYKKYKHRIEAL